MRRRCGEECAPVKPVLKIRRAPWLWLGFCKASSAAKLVIAAARAHRDLNFARHAVTPALVLATSRKHAIAALRAKSSAAPRAQMSLLTLLNDELILKVCVYANSPRTLTDPPGGYAAVSYTHLTLPTILLV